MRKTYISLGKFVEDNEFDTFIQKIKLVTLLISSGTGVSTSTIFSVSAIVGIWIWIFYMSVSRGSTLEYLNI